MDSPADVELASEKRPQPQDTPTDPSLKSANETNEAQDEQYPSPMQRTLVMISTTLAAFLMLLDAAVVATATPKITSDFHSLDDIGWYGTAYFLGICTVQPLTGKIYTFFNIKWTFLVFFAVFEVGSAICGAASSSAMLCIGRAVAGLGASGLLNGALSMIPHLVPADKRPKYQGILIGFSLFGILAGPLVGGALTDHASWRWCFYINLPCGALIALFLVFVPVTQKGKDEKRDLPLREKIGQLDMIGFCLFAPTIVMLILALQWGGTEHPWGSATIIGLFCGAFVNLLVFLAWEHRIGPGAMIPLQLLRRRIIWSSCLNIMCYIGCNYISSYYWPIYFQAVRGASPTQSGVDMLPYIITNIVVTVVTGVLVGRLGYYFPFGVASGVFTSIGTGLVTTLTPHSSTGARVGFQIIQGFQGMGFQVPLLAAQNAVSKDEMHVANALIVFFQNLSASIFLSIAEVIFGSRLRHNLAVNAPDVDILAVIHTGASAKGIKAVVPEDLLPGVKLAYSNTFSEVMYLATSAACFAFLFAMGMGWVRITKTTST